MRFSAVCFTLIAVVHLQTGISILANNLNRVCNSTECQKLGEFYLQNMDLLEQPCSDFYDYVCGNWGQHNPRPKELNIQYLWNIDKSLELKALQGMRTLLESQVSSMPEGFEQAQLLYRTCMSGPSVGISSPSAIWNVMKKIAEFPILTRRDKAVSNRPYFWEIDELYIQKAGESALFEFYPIFEESSKNEIVTNLQVLPSAYGTLFCSSNWLFPVEHKSYKAFLTRVIKTIVGPNQPIMPEVMEQDLNAVLKFRETLNKIITEFSDDKLEIMTIKKFQGLYSEVVKSQPAANINWLDVITAMYQNPDDPWNKLTITEKSKVMVNMNYFSHLAVILGETSKRTIVNHIHLHFAERHLELTPQMKAELQGSLAVCRKGRHAAVRSAEPRLQKCINTNIMRAALGKAYANSNFPPQQKSKLQDLFEATKKAMKKQILQSTWLDAPAKEASINKLMNVKATIGYPDEYDAPGKLKLFTKRRSLEMDPFAYKHMYSPEQNRISVTAAVLQWPIYSLNRPYAIDYGSVASLFGYELHRVFDADGISSKASGKSPLSSPKMIAEYHNATRCFENQYEKYKKSSIGPLELNTATTMEEDILDVMGLKVAYTAFKEMLQDNNGVCPVVPGFEKHGCEKLFFIAYASKFCSHFQPGYYELSSYKGGQNLPQIKVNVAVANMKEFSTAFNCRPADPLNLKRTCDLWQP